MALQTNQHEVGRLDRRILIQEPVETRDSTNDQVLSWQELVNVWAELIEPSGGEKYEADRQTETVKQRWRIRYRIGLNAKMRIRWNSNNYDILAIRQEGRNRYLILETQLKT